MITALFAAVVLGFGSLSTTVGTAAAADPDTEPPWTILHQLDQYIGWTTVVVTFTTLWQDPTDTFECKLDAGEWIDCVSPWQLDGLSEGWHEVAVRATDAAGNTDPTPEIQTFNVDLSGPVGQLALNSGAASTARSQVHLTMANSDGVNDYQIRISNDPEVDGQGLLVNAWEGYEWQFSQRQYGWDVAAADYGGTPASGLKSVYLQFLDRFGNVGPVTSDAITYTPGITPVIVKITLGENPAELGGPVRFRATVRAADGANIRDGTFTLGPCPDGTGPVDGRGELELVIDCSTWKLGGEIGVSATFAGSSELAYGYASTKLEIGPARDETPPRVFLSPGILDDGDPYEDIQVDSTQGEATAFECRIDGGAWKACGPVWRVTRPGRGAHLLEARGRDLGGRWSLVNAIIPWRIGQTLTAGGITFDDTQANAGLATRDPVMGLGFWLPSPGATAVRVSSSRGLDAQGRLAQAIEIQSPTNDTKLEFDTENSATGGVKGDGHKWVVVQWRAANGAWDVPEIFSFRVDRKAPSLKLTVNGGAPFVDDDDVLVMIRSDEAHEIRVVYSTVRSRLEESPPNGRDLAGGMWHVDDVPAGSAATRTLYARAVDLAGHWSPIASATVTIDRSTPVASLYSPGFVLGSRVTTTSVPVRIGGVATDTGSGIARTRLQEAVGSGAFAALSTTTDATPSIVRNLKPSVPRTYRLRGEDRVGHVGAWRLGPTLAPYLRDETSAAIAYGPGWRRISATPAIGSDVMRSAVSGARLDFSFTGRAVAIIAPKRSSLGRAKVYLDGAYVSTIDLRAGATGSQLVVFASKWTTPGPHRITLRVIASSGRPFDLDGIAVLP